MSTQNKSKNTSPPGPSPVKDQNEPTRGSTAYIDWQTGQAQESTTTERGSSKIGGKRRGEKKPDHTFSKRQPEPDFAMKRMLKEDQNGTAPWVPVWTLKASGGGERK